MRVTKSEITTTPITAPHLVLCEGPDDGALLEAIAASMGLEAGDLQIWECGGVTRIKGVVPGLEAATGFGSVRGLALVRDSDDNHASSFLACADWLSNAGYPRPADPGHFVKSSTSGIGVGALTLPIDAAGCIESLFRASVKNQPLGRCVEDFMMCGATKLVGVTRVCQLDKIYSDAYLVLAAGGISFNFAIQRGLVDIGHETFAFVRNFVTELATQ